MPTIYHTENYFQIGKRYINKVERESDFITLENYLVYQTVFVIDCFEMK